MSVFPSSVYISHYSLLYHFNVLSFWLISIAFSISTSEGFLSLSPLQLKLFSLFEGVVSSGEIITFLMRQQKIPCLFNCRTLQADKVQTLVWNLQIISLLPGSQYYCTRDFASAKFHLFIFLWQAKIIPYSWPKLPFHCIYLDCVATLSLLACTSVHNLSEPFSLMSVFSKEQQHMSLSEDLLYYLMFSCYM